MRQTWCDGHAAWMEVTADSQWSVRTVIIDGQPDFRFYCCWQCEPTVSVDLNLLDKLASGEGGRRTGALKRAGYLEWTVTAKGLEALAKTEKP